MAVALPSCLTWESVLQADGPDSCLAGTFLFFSHFWSVNCSTHLVPAQSLGEQNSSFPKRGIPYDLSFWRLDEIFSIQIHQTKDYFEKSRFYHSFVFHKLLFPHLKKASERNRHWVSSLTLCSLIAHRNKEWLSPSLSEGLVLRLSDKHRLSPFGGYCLKDVDPTTWGTFSFWSPSLHPSLTHPSSLTPGKAHPATRLSNCLGELSVIGHVISPWIVTGFCSDVTLQVRYSLVSTLSCYFLSLAFIGHCGTQLSLSRANTQVK